MSFTVRGALRLPLTVLPLVALLRLSIGLFSFAATGCTTASQGSTVSIPPEARGDDDYIK
jgi:hypothetical protein